MRKHSVLGILCAIGYQYAGAQANDTTKQSNYNWTTHFQTTIISQSHAGFRASYSGDKSLADSVETGATSLTATLYLGRKLWKGATLYFNPEVSGGRGLSYASGVAGALNGETYRVGAVEPQIFVARAYLQQNIALPHTDYEDVADGTNQVQGKIPTSRITISAGKFAIADFFDGNTYSKDPRSQFFNWSLWANGAWDYPANTRGYTMGVVAGLIKPDWSLRFSSVAVPRIANFHTMEYNTHAHAETFEFQHKLKINKRPGNIRFLVSANFNRAPSYTDGVKAVAAKDTFLLNVIEGNAENNKYGGRKYGLGLDMEQELTNTVGLFARIGWNDGQYASWAFTEIDRTASLGLSVKGNKWKRPDDVCGIATVVNGISADHRAFLKAGGYGFIIGDGNLDYGLENIIEAYYNAKVLSFLWLSVDYQFVNNPGYNKDRGPVHVFGIRGHVEL